MPGLNKGEWNEFYTLLYLLENSNINIVDSDLRVIDSSIFFINKLITQGETSLTYQKEEDIINIFKNAKKIGTVNLEDAINAKDFILNTLVSKMKLNRGSIELPSLDAFSDDFTKGYSIKGKSKSKADLGANVKDNKICKDVDITYSLKSQFGSPATLLNASKHTNFMYRILGFNSEKC